jgi:RNA polymerase sigma factor (sigma-70 family)
MAVVSRTRPGRPDPDLPLVLGHQAGAADAFTRLWRKYEPRLRRYFLQATRSDADADDLASDTFLAALRSMPRYSADGAGPDGGNAALFSTYLYAIARNQLSLWRRRRRRHPEMPLSLSGREGEDDLEAEVRPLASGVSDAELRDPSELLLEAERGDAICRALASLDSDAQFCAVLLHYVAGWTHEDVGQFLGARKESVNSRLQDGRRSLRRGIETFDPRAAPT